MTHAGAGRDCLPGTAACWGRISAPTFATATLLTGSHEVTATLLTGSDDADHCVQPQKTAYSLLFGSFLADSLEGLRVIASTLYKGCTVAAAAAWFPCWSLEMDSNSKEKTTTKQAAYKFTILGK